MDPDKNMEMQIELANEILDSGENLAERAVELADLVLDLVGWLENNGAPPKLMCQKCSA